MKVNMKKLLKNITVYVMALVFCLVFADTAKAETIYYDIYILGEEVTSNNMSGEGWRFEPATEEDGYNKLYLTNANLVVDDSTITEDVDGQAIHMWDNLEIVLKGDNTINMIATDLSGIEYYDAIDANNLVLSGEGSLTIKGNDYETEKTSTCLIYTDGFLEIKENIELNIQGMTIKGTREIDWGIYAYGLYSDKGIIINSNAKINISGLGFNHIMNNSVCRVFGMAANDQTVIHDNAIINIELDDVCVTGGSATCALIETDQLVIDNNVTMNLAMNSVEAEIVTCVGIGTYGGISVGDNANISVDTGNAIYEESDSYEIIGIDTKVFEIGNNSKLNIKGSDCDVKSEVFEASGIGIHCMSIIMGDGTIVDVSSGKNGLLGCTSIYLTMGKDSILRCQGSQIAYAAMRSSIASETTAYPTFGGSKSSELKKLDFIEYEVLGEICDCAAYGNEIAKYVEIGPLLTINLKCDNGTVDKKNFTMHNGRAIGTLPTPVSSRKGYVFNGWYTAPTGGSKVYSTTKMTKSTTLYAQWKKITYTINFNGNGGTVGVEKKWVEYGNAMEFMPTPKRECYTFTGWYTAKTGGTKVYSTTKPTKSMTLYAQWKLNTYTIKFDGNGGTVGVEKKWVDHGNPMEFMPTPKRSGYTFTGWYTAASGGSKVYSTTKVTKNMTLYAQWKKNTCTITFNANGGKVSTTSKTVNGGTAIGTMPTLTRSGYTFTGWFTAKTGGSKVYSTTKATANMTLYAQWKKK